MKKNIIMFFIFTVIYCRAADFSVATINVLHEKFYTFDKKSPRMPFDKRIVAFKKYMPQNTDIICMQEWPYDVTSASYGKFSTALKVVYPMQNYEHIMAQFGKFNAVHGPCIVFNKQKFKKVDGPWTLFFECSAGKNQQGQWSNGRLSCAQGATITKACVVVILDSLKNKNQKIGVISAHIPWVKGGFHAESVNMIKDIVQKNSAVTRWVICGDFNYDTHKNNAGYNSLKNIFGNGWGSSRDAGNDYTACSVNNDDKMVMDYIFYNNVTPEGNVEVSPSFNKLIRHKTTTNKYFDDYFSDHAVVRMEFNMVSQKAPVQQPISVVHPVAPVPRNVVPAVSAQQNIRNNVQSIQSASSIAPQKKNVRPAQVSKQSEASQQQSFKAMHRNQSRIVVAWNNFLNYMKSFFRR